MLYTVREKQPRTAGRMMTSRPHPQQAGLLLRSLGAGAGGGGGGGARHGAMKSATSLLLGAALATAFFLLYTSLGRDLGAAGAAPRAGSSLETGAPATGVDRQEARERVVEPKQHGAATKPVVASSDGDGIGGGGGGGGPTTEEKGQSEKQQQEQRIVMPATSTQNHLQVMVIFVFLTTLSLPFDLICSAKYFE